MTTGTSDAPLSMALLGQRVALVGRLAGMSRRDAQQLLRQHGAAIVDPPDASATLVVVGENESLLGDGSLEEKLDAAVREAADQGSLEIIGESQLWQRLGLVDRQQDIHQLHTPPALAKLLGVPVSTIRRWQRRGWIVPAREVRRLAYFDFQEVATARRLTELLAAGVSAAAIEKKLAALARYLPNVKRPLAQLSIIVEGKNLLLRQGDGLVEPGGQLRFDFGALADEAAATGGQIAMATNILTFDARAEMPPLDPAEMVLLAGELEDEGQLEAAAEMYRTAMAAGGPTAETLLPAGRTALPDARLAGRAGTLLHGHRAGRRLRRSAGQPGLRAGRLGRTGAGHRRVHRALAYHDAYPDAHYHLARLLDDAGRTGEAEAHWDAFLRLSPGSPWADEARERLECR